jgi:hypothetical protein
LVQNAVNRPRRDGWKARGGHYEYRVLTIEPPAGRNDVRRLLTEEAEYGRWELARSLLYAGGRRKIWLRRKIIHVESTL